MCEYGQAAINSRNKAGRDGGFLLILDVTITPARTIPMARTIALFFISLFLLVQMAAFPAAAAPDAAGAAHLKTMFVEFLNNQKASAKTQKRELRAEGDVLVEPAGSYYAITLPHLSMVEPDGSYTDVGILALNAMPGEKPGEWKMTVAVPTPIMGYGADKKPALRIDIGKQSFTGLWNESVGNFTKLDARYENITALQSAEGLTLKIPKASVLYDLTPSSTGKTWSGPVKYLMENISLTKDGDPGQSKIGKLAIDMMVYDYSPDAVRDYQDKINAMADAISAAPEGTISAEQTKGLYNLVFDFISSVWDGFDSTVTVSDLELSRPAIPGSPAGKILLQKAGFGFNAKGFRSDSVALRLTTQYDGLKVTPAPAGFEEATPSRLNMDLSIDKLPYKELVALGRQTLQTASAMPDGNKAAGMQAAELIPQLLTQAGTYLKIRKSFFGNNTYNVLMDGQMNANLKAVMGADGKARLEMAGLDQLVASLKSRLKDPALTPEQKQSLQGTLVTLTVLQLSGQQGKNAAGQAIRSYDLELTNEGKIMVNGADLSAIQALAGAAAGQDKAAPKETPAPKVP